jgi:ribosomal protein S27E
MKTKELDPQNLGPKEDWEGNNIAFACPACGEVYIVSERIHGERKCPACGKSRGIVTGGKDSGGIASIICDEAPAFTVGRKYSRREISAVLGGSEVDFLPTNDKHVVCGCFTLEHNPEAPDIVIPGTGKVIKREAKLFCEQDYPVPIFIKRRTNEWEYVGDYKAVRFSTSPEEIAARQKGSITPLNEVTRVIFLQRAAMS